MKCDELKAYTCGGWFCDKEAYPKDDVDKVIADLEESHKKEVEQLLMEIVEMEKACRDKDDWCLHTLKENCHHKYKRCLDKAYVEWLKQIILCNYPQSFIYRRAAIRKRKWLELAEKFNSNSTLQQKDYK